MGTWLMLKNTPVYSIETEKVLNKALLPGLMQKKANRHTFNAWMLTRYSERSNAVSRQLRGITFGQGNRGKINAATMALSLSDCYWIRDSYKEGLRFEMVSPYYTDFWKGAGVYAGGAIPTLYVNGCKNKYWESSEWLVKLGKENLIECSCRVMCDVLEYRVADIQPLPDGSGIKVRNFTDPLHLLEQADQEGSIDPDGFTEEDIIAEYGLSGFKMVLLDAIIGNGDRHAGNFGRLLSAIDRYRSEDGVSMAPFYDFDHALDSAATRDLLTKTALKLARTRREFYEEALRALSLASTVGVHPVFKRRAAAMIRDLETA